MSRLTLLFGVSSLIWLGLASRLFYWQIIRSDQLSGLAQLQYQKQLRLSGSRGKISTSDGRMLVGNQTVYRVAIEPPLLDKPMTDVIDQLWPILASQAAQVASTAGIITANQFSATASPAGTVNLLNLDQIKAELLVKVTQLAEAKWLGIWPQVDQTTKNQLADLQLPGVKFEPYEIRDYPEASLAAHVVGFVGKNEAGKDIGYFGIEGALDKELQPRAVVKQIEKNLLGYVWSDQAESASTMGRDVVLTIRRDIQNLVEEQLQFGVQKYGAAAGEVVIMAPQTGFILAAAAYPNYYPSHFWLFEPSLYRNPLLTQLFEPGSTFKVITVATAINNQAVTPDTICTQCQGPRQIDKYTIRTWNNEYHPNITVTDALAKSDNIAMVFVQELLGKDKFITGIQDFGFGQSVTADLQEDSSTPLPEKYGPVELANMAFGQGLSMNSLQLTRAIGAIANRGQLMQVQIVAKVIDPVTNQEVITQPKILRQIISPQTADQVTQMMINAAAQGEAKWTASSTHLIAGKTGTAQIAFEGRYDPNKTIASFIGFAPPTHPKFMMLVKLTEPSSSPWAAETAAPMWYKIANKLYLLLNIPPDKAATN